MGDNNNNNKAALWKKVKSITNREEELLQIKNFDKLHSRLGFGTMKKTEENNNQTRKKRVRPIKETLDDEEEEAPSKALKKKSRMMKKIASKNVQDLPIGIQNRIAELNGRDTQFLMSKKLYKTDVNVTNNRLSLPENSIKCEFLNEAENECIIEGFGLDVTVLDPCLREYSLVLKKWKMKRVFVYNLITKWNKLASDNKFKEDHELQIWSFRVNGKLYFVLNKL